MSQPRWNPIRLPITPFPPSQLDQQIERAFDELLTTPWLSEAASWMPQLDVFETDNEFVVEADLPGVPVDKLQVRVDPNRAYSPQEAADLAKRLEQFDLQYFEQPIMAEPLADARWLSDQTTIPIALNESVVEPDSVMQILREDAASHILPDTHIAGGILPCVKIGTLCEAADIPCIMHCGHDLGPKTAAMLHVAASCPSYTLANDCTYYGLVDDVITEMIPIENGRMRVPTSPGLGIECDVEKLEHYSI